MKKILLLSSMIAVFAGCGREEIQTYHVPKEPSAPPVAQAPSRPAPALQSAPSRPSGTGFRAELPEGWTEKPGSGMRTVSYAIEGTSIDFYLIALAMGDVPSNVNRWRGQVGLADATPAEIATDAETIKIEGHTATYIEIYNEEGGKGIIAAIIDLAPRYWYFTAKGSVAELKAHAPEIRAFLESIQFEGHNH